MKNFGMENFAEALGSDGQGADLKWPAARVAGGAAGEGEREVSYRPPSAMDEQRKLLDQLMGLDRDLPPDQRTGKKKRFTDPEICKHYLCGISPWYAFKNTRSFGDVYRHLGEYDKVCDDECKRQWEELPQREKDGYGYEHDLMVLLERLVQESDRRIQRGTERIEKENAPTPLTEEERAKVERWAEDLRELSDRADEAAEAVEVDACESATRKILVLKRMRDDLQRSKYPDRVHSVCPVSGVLMCSADGDARLQEHIQGKQYKGWKAIREKLAELKGRNPPPAKGRQDRRGERDGGPRGDRSRRRDRDRDWDRGRDYRRDRDDDRSRDRDPPGYRRRRRSRSRSRERGYRR